MLDQYDDSHNSQFTRVLLTSVDDSGPQQLVAATGIDGQAIGEAVRVQHFGESSVPPAGAEGLALLGGGRFDKAFLFGFEHPDKRPKSLPAGAKAIYDASGNIIKLLGSTGIVHDAGGNPQTFKGKSLALQASSGSASLGSSSGKTYLGGDGTDGTYAAVMTESGPSSTVFCKL